MTRSFKVFILNTLIFLLLFPMCHVCGTVLFFSFLKLKLSFYSHMTPSKETKIDPGEACTFLPLHVQLLIINENCCHILLMDYLFQL